MCVRMRRARVIFGSLLAAYLGSYVILSANGRYEPECIGIDHVKWYAWTPLGFMKDYKKRRYLYLAYLPAYIVDFRYWHTCDDATSGRYPINKAAEHEIGKIHRAWR